MTRKRSVRSGFEQRFLAKLLECGVRNGDRLVLGFSGGPDSLALAYAMRQVAPVLELAPLLAHVDHGLRARSRQDALKCEELAMEIGISFRSSALPTGLVERSASVGIEEQARRERYRALATLASDWGADSIVLGHQSDDQAETVLMHLVRGSGSRGLGGMRLVQARTIPWWDESDDTLGEFRILRPLLSESRTTIESYLEEVGASPLVDESNLGDEFDRNWVRHHVLPAIRERWPRAVQTIARSATSLQLESDYFDSAIRKQGLRPIKNDRTLRTDSFAGVDRALRFHAIRDWLHAIGVDQPDFDVVAHIYEFIGKADESLAVEIGSGHTAVLANGSLMTFADLLTEGSARLPLQDIGLEPRWHVSFADDRSKTADDIEIAYRDAPTVRNVLPGDRWAGTHRTVTEDLRAAGFHPMLRRHVLAVASSEGVLLIPAIYPTIHANVAGEGTRKGWVRWQRV
jgi:tRNA(Ile)-lysidine synthetase-like protein